MILLKKSIFLFLGLISIIVGTIGIFLPLLPTTPFLLLSLYCFGKSSKKFHNFILENKIFGKYIKDYHEKKGITLKNKLSALLLLSVSMSFSIYKITQIHLRIFLIIVFLGVTYHILSLKTLNEKKES
ncbi:YbaN family protein [Fusobacterium perfoetens]|uniref:YbaN family protein n=1 Tax=Fusobacterium TaxID=848 RepID=UPI0026EBE534|nr:YbaN family protein [Fusobacterium perfoetens]